MKNNNKNKKEKDECPLCNISEETIKRLKEKGKTKKELSDKNDKK